MEVLIDKWEISLLLSLLRAHCEAPIKEPHEDTLMKKLEELYTTDANSFMILDLKEKSNGNHIRQTRI